MDELELLRARRPEPNPASPEDRARALEALMHTINDNQTAGPEGSVDPIPLAPPAGRRPRRRWVAMTGAAAALAIGALAVGASGNGPAPLRAEPSAADQLRTIAGRVESEGAYPATPWMRRSTSSTNYTQPQIDQQTDQNEYRFANGDLVNEVPGCKADCFLSARLGSGSTVPANGSADEVRAAVEAEVDALLASYDDVPPEVASGEVVSVQSPEDKPSRNEALVDVIAAALAQPTMGPAARAELLRLLADQPGLTAEEGQTTSLGDRGTRFTAGDDERHTSVVVDPTDGYLYEVKTVDNRGETAAPVTFDGGQISQIRGSEVQTWSRPTTTSPAKDVADLAAQVTDAHDTIEGAGGDGGCVGGGGFSEGPDAYGVKVPENLSYVHCW